MSGSLSRLRNRRICSSGVMWRKSFTILIPSAISMRSKSLISSRPSSTLPPVAKPSTRSTMTRPYHERSNTTIWPCCGAAPRSAGDSAASFRAPSARRSSGPEAARIERPAEPPHDAALARRVPALEHDDRAVRAGEIGLLDALERLLELGEAPLVVGEVDGGKMPDVGEARVSGDDEVGGFHGSPQQIETPSTMRLLPPAPKLAREPAPFGGARRRSPRRVGRRASLVRPIGRRDPAPAVCRAWRDHSTNARAPRGLPVRSLANISPPRNPAALQLTACLC